MAGLQVEVVTQEENILSEEVDQITVPSTDGELTILPHHQSLTATMKAGEVVLKANGVEKRLVVSPGFIQVTAGKVVVLADSAIREDDLDEERAREAKEAAEEAMVHLEIESEIAITQGTIERTIMELRSIHRRAARH